MSVASIAHYMTLAWHHKVTINIPQLIYSNKRGGRIEIAIDSKVKHFDFEEGISYKSHEIHSGLYSLNNNRENYTAFQETKTAIFNCWKFRLDCGLPLAA